MPKLIQALQGGELDGIDLQIIGPLYELASRKSAWTVGPFTLEQLIEITDWRLEKDTLYRRLGRLLRSGWITYPTTPGRKRHAYVITLLGKPIRSEDGPSTQPLKVSGSEQSTDEARPSTSHCDPRIERTLTADDRRNSGSRTAEGLRAPIDVRDKITTRSEEKLDHVVGKTTDLDLVDEVEDVRGDRVDDVKVETGRGHWSDRLVEKRGPARRSDENPSSRLDLPARLDHQVEQISRHEEHRVARKETQKFESSTPHPGHDRNEQLLLEVDAGLAHRVNEEPKG
jgi:hypothetical protein